VSLAFVADVSDVPVERLDVVAIGIEEERRVVAEAVRPIPGRAVGAEARVDAGTMERVDLSFEAARKQRWRSRVGGCRSTTLRLAKEVQRSSSLTRSLGTPSGAITVS
jgi:hypothetical protein